MHEIQGHLATRVKHNSLCEQRVGWGNLKEAALACGLGLARPDNEGLPQMDSNHQPAGQLFSQVSPLLTNDPNSVEYAA